MSIQPVASRAQRVLLQNDFDRFARLTGDDNPIHCDPAFAARSHFGATVAHGMLLYSCLCQQLSEQIGPGTVALEQHLMFPAPTFVGDRLVLTLAGTATADGSLAVTTEIAKVSTGETALPVPEVTATGACIVLTPDTPLRAPAAPDSTLPPGDPALYGLKPGMQACRSRAFTLADLDEYGDLSGDRNPLFRDHAFARRRGFATRLVPWPLLAGMFSDLLGTRLPGRGTGWMKQRLRFPAAAYPGETLLATVRILRLRADKELVDLATKVVAPDGRVVCDGEALVLVRNLADKGPKPDLVVAGA